MVIRRKPLSRDKSMFAIRVGPFQDKIQAHTFGRKLTSQNIEFESSSVQYLEENNSYAGIINIIKL